jgi:hypothetical protein
MTQIRKRLKVIAGALLLKFDRSIKILLAGLLINFFIEMTKTTFFPGLIPGILSLGAMSCVFGISLKLAFKKEKSDVPEAYRNLFPKQ